MFGVRLIALMTSLSYKEQEKFYILVNCLILGFKNDKLYLLISKRKSEPLKGQNSLIEGFAESEESLSDAVLRIVYEYTGMQDAFTEQVGVYDEAKCYSGERVVSLAYYSLIDTQLFDEQLCKENNVHWCELDKVGQLVFDHNRIVNDTIEVLRNKVTSSPIGFNLLPEKFTLPQMQSLYEAIYQTELDKRNFRKKIMEMDILEKQEDKDKFSSRRGAFYYKFNKEKYDQLLKRGSFFSL